MWKVRKELLLMRFVASCTVFVGFGETLHWDFHGQLVCTTHGFKWGRLLFVLQLMACGGFLFSFSAVDSVTSFNLKNHIGLLWLSHDKLLELFCVIYVMW
ncbi:unnamed protein product [Lathyrus sativus]|nr:unnamed protein product [Lathyrus sativus]